MEKLLRYLKYQKALGIKEVIVPWSEKELKNKMQKTSSVIASATKQSNMAPSVIASAAKQSHRGSDETATGSRKNPRDDKAFAKDPVSHKRINTQNLPEDLKKCESLVSQCFNCALHKGRTQTVFGTGNTKAELMFVGEGPGRDEDLKGEPFVGRAGKLLTKIIQAMGLERKDVYICNIVKCRPPNNRAPLPKEEEECTPYLLKQIELIKPKIVVALGTSAAQFLLKSDAPISHIRGKFFDFHGSKLLPTFHPAYLLRNPNMKRPVWEDMQLVMKELKK